jgi:hypothetical protein
MMRSHVCTHFTGAIGLSLIVLSLAACGSGIKAGSEDSFTRGLALRMLVTDRESSHALYELSPDGSITFAGGFNALNGRPSWEGLATPEEVDELHTLLAAHGWFDHDPVPDPPDPDNLADTRIHRVNLAWPTGGRAFEAHGGGTHIDPIRQHLERIAAKRFDPVLQQLPEPGRLDD